MQFSPPVAIDGYLGQAAAQHCPALLSDLVYGLHVTGGQPVGILSGHIERFPSVFTRSAKRLARGVIQRRPGVFPTQDQIRQ